MPFIYRTTLTFFILFAFFGLPLTSITLPSVAHAQTPPAAPVDFSGDFTTSDNGQVQSTGGSSGSGVAGNAAGAIAGCLASAALQTGISAGVGAVSTILSVPTSDFSVKLNTGAIQLSTGGVFAKNCILDGIAKAIAKDIITRLTASIVNWANSGFNGSPTFLQDPGQFFKNIGNQELGKIIDGSGLGFLCQPFRPLIQVAFLQRYQQTQQGTQAQCTVTKIISNYKGFVQGNFEDGGWTGWLALTTGSNNNIYDATVNTTAKVNSSIGNQQAIATQKLSWGQGFISLVDNNGKVTTPGAIVVNQLNKAIGTDQDQLGLVKSFDDIVTALVNAGITKLMGSGLSHI